MERLLGLLKVKVVSGVSLAICDPLAHSSDPYVVICLGQQKVKSGIKYKSTNPEWNEELTLSITNWTLPVKIEVFDHDTFTKDDSMGDADFSILDFVEIAKKDLSHVPHDTVMKTRRSTLTRATASPPRATSHGKTARSLRTLSSS
ncbi:hypothetical protein CFC21_023085 [Triticum aestivum]|uniref:C2 domain-containing protein n=3 Tax=Triticum TaxID=4564 RepID=A0A9R1PL63_TRITD|nr:hypothetical protein CFC21_023085 [Triticum aestivum]VAH45524.1 unnamed protein product [Triticum turgidum subsp. durum]